MKTLKRSELLNTLQSVESGLTSSDENLQQSSCFVFRHGTVATFNEEVLCTAPCDVGFEGAVPAKLLLTLLSKMSEDEITIEATKKQVVVSGKNKKSGIRFDRKVVLPTDSVEMPKKWNKLPEGFITAVDLAQNCCSNSDLHFGIRCVHFTPRAIEATDNVQACRVDIKTGLKQDALVRRDAVAALVNANLTKYAESEHWLHFRSPNQRVISVRRYVEKYPDLAKVFQFKGSKISIPKGLADAADKAAIFAGEDTSVAARELITVSLKEGHLTVSGESVNGWYNEREKVKYHGPAMEFAIAPATLMRIAKEHTNAAVTENRLCIDGEGWRLIFCLFRKPAKTEKGE